MLRLEKSISELLKENGYKSYDNVMRPQKLDEEIVYVVKIANEDPRDNNLCGGFSGEFTFTISALSPKIINVEEVTSSLESIYDIVKDADNLNIIDTYDDTLVNRGYFKEGGYVMDLVFTAMIYAGI